MLTLKEQKERYEMYLGGATDQEIGDKLGYAPETIQNWRVERNLPYNYGREIEVDDKYVKNRNRYRNRISFVNKCVKNASSILSAESSIDKDENTHFLKISFRVDTVAENILLVNMKDDNYFVTDKDFEKYVNSRIKSLMCKFIRSLYDVRGK